MSTHFTHSLAVLVTTAVLLVAGWFGVRHLLDTQAGSVPYALGKNDREIISYNSASHILTQTTATGTTKTYVRNPEIVVGKNGSITMKSSTFAFEVVPFIGIGYSTQFNTYVGVNLLNVWRVDGGLALAYAPAHTTGLVVVGVNVWRNTNISLGYDLQKNVHALVSVHF